MVMYCRATPGKKEAAELISLLCLFWGRNLLDFHQARAASFFLFVFLGNFFGGLDFCYFCKGNFSGRLLITSVCLVST